MKDIVYLKMITGEDLISIIDYERLSSTSIVLSYPYVVHKTVANEEGDMYYSAAPWAIFMDDDYVRPLYIVPTVNVMFIAKASYTMKGDYWDWLEEAEYNVIDLLKEESYEPHGLSEKEDYDNPQKENQEDRMWKKLLSDFDVKGSKVN